MVLVGTDGWRMTGGVSGLGSGGGRVEISPGLYGGWVGRVDGGGGSEGWRGWVFGW